MKTITTLFFSGFAFLSFSQVTLQATDLNPVVGDAYTVYSATYVAPGSSGSNVTWDLSSMQPIGSPGIMDHQAPSPNYPTTNIQIVNMVTTPTEITHMIASSTSQIYVAQESDGVVTDYSDPMQVLAFPVTDGLDVTDPLAATFTSNGIDFTRTGTTHIQASGWGTLITPEGTFTDVVRVRLEIDIADASSVLNVTYNTITYMWYKAGYHYPLAAVAEFTTSLSPNPQYSGVYMEVDGVGTEEITNSALSVHPNPSGGVVTIETESFNKASVINALGQVVLTSDQKQFDLSSFESGIYTVFVEDLSGNIVSERLVLTD